MQRAAALLPQETLVGIKGPRGRLRSPGNCIKLNQKKVDCPGPPSSKRHEVPDRLSSQFILVGQPRVVSSTGNKVPEVAHRSERGLTALVGAYKR